MERSFDSQVRNALAHLYDLPYLRAHPLARSLGPDVPADQAGAVLQERILAALEALKPQGRNEEKALRRYRLFHLRYVDGVGIDAVCRELGISRREYHREQSLGMESIAASLRARAPEEGLPGLPFVTPLVGRASQLGVLRGLFEEAVAEHGRMALLMGEPGAGKTRLAREFGRSAEGRGGLFLEGRYLRDGSVAYAPWAEALGGSVRHLNDRELREVAGPYAGHVARLIPELAARLGPPAPPPGEGDEQYVLFNGVTSILDGIARKRPVVLLLDDLQWAEDLALVTHVARRLPDMPVLVLAAYREQEFNERMVLVRAWGEWNRSRLCTAVPVSPLTLEQTGEMVTHLFDAGAAERLRESVYATTRGNAFFVEEVARSLVEDEAVRRGASGWEVAEATRITLPRSLRLAVDERVARLGDTARDALLHAAVLGQEFEAPVLQAVCGLNDESFFEMLDRAETANLLVDQSFTGSERYAFADDHIQEALYDGLTMARRRRYHVQAARALETFHQDRLDDHLEELARHLGESTEREDCEKAIAYGERAAGLALDVYAYRTAAGHLERCVRLQGRLDPEDKARRCELLLALCSALMSAREPLRVVEEVAPQALALAEAIGDRSKAFQVCRIATAAITRYAGHGVPPVCQEWIERADGWAAPGGIERALADLELARLREQQGRTRDAAGLMFSALDCARAEGDVAAMFEAAQLMLMAHGLPRDQKALYALACDCVRWPRAGIDIRTISGVLSRVAPVFFAWGDRPAAEAARDEHRALSDRTDDPMIQIRSIAMDAWFAFVDGRLEENLATARRMIAFASASGSHQLVQGYVRGVTRLSLIYMGLPDDEIAAPLPTRAAQLPSGVTAQRQAYLGCQAEARQTLRGNVKRWVTESSFADISQRALLTMLDASVLAGDVEMAGILSKPVERCDLMLGSSGIFDFTGVARHLGGAAALLGDAERARGYCAKALELSEQVNFRPEIALSHLQIAELLAGIGGAARVHLEQAIPELKEMKMRLPLERALRLQTALQVG